MTRAIFSFARLDIAAAIAYHPLVLLTPLIAVMFLFEENLFGKRIFFVLNVAVGVSFALVWLLRIFGIIPLP